MTFAWYGHLKFAHSQPLYWAIGLSWFIAFFEYCLQVPANRLGFQTFSLPQLKIMQEVITLLVFAGFAWAYMGVKLSWDYFWAGLSLLVAVYFVFREKIS